MADSAPAAALERLRIAASTQGLALGEQTVEWDLALVASAARNGGFDFAWRRFEQRRQRDRENAAALAVFALCLLALGLGLACRAGVRFSVTFPVLPLHRS